MTRASRARRKLKGESKASPARLAALRTLRLCRERDGFAQDIMASTVDGADLAPEDRAFATRLVLGAVSCAGTLDEAIDSCLDSPKDVRPNVRDALRVSAYELLFLKKSPHAAVDQGVELVRAAAPRAAGLGNAVLRRLAKLADGFPFGDPATDLSAFARSQGFPLWIAEKLSDDLGAEAARGFMEASNEPAPLFVAANALTATDGEVRSLLDEAGAKPSLVEVEGEPVAGCFRLGNRRALLEPVVEAALQRGELLVADAASQAVAAAVAQKARAMSRAAGGPIALLEVGAGRATKTILLQSGAFRENGRRCFDHFAIDNAAFKVELLRERTVACGAELVAAKAADGANLEAAFGNERFDLIFIDAPCTGLGTLRRHPEIRWRLKPQNIEEAAVLDGRLLESAARQLNPGGAIAYATCTVTPEENEGAIRRFLAAEAGTDFTRERTLQTRLNPGGSSPDAHFLCILTKKS